MNPIQFTTCLTFPNTPYKEAWQRSNRERKSNKKPTIEQTVVDCLFHAQKFEEIPCVAAVKVGEDTYLISITKQRHEENNGGADRA